MHHNLFDLLGSKVGVGHPCFVIGEIGLNHNGDLKIAKQLIKIATEVGCDAVKFQKRDVDNLAVTSVLDAKDDRFPEFGSTYREVRRHIEFDREQFQDLMSFAGDCRIPLFCTPFDISSVDFLETLGMEAYKLASHSLTNLPLLNHVARLGKAVILSTGMASLEEVDQAVEIFRRVKSPLVLMHCVSSYPTPTDQCNLRLIDLYQERYQIPVGYSGHEVGWIPTLAAVARGACVIERHITLDKNLVGFDHKLSLTPTELAQMVKEIRVVEATLGTGEKKVTDVEQVTRNKYHVSWVSRVEIPAGTVITENMLILKNPGTGIPASQAHLLIGKRARVTVPKDVLMDRTHIE